MQTSSKRAHEHFKIFLWLYFHYFVSTVQGKHAKMIFSLIHINTYICSVFLGTKKIRQKNHFHGLINLNLNPDPNKVRL